MSTLKSKIISAPINGATVESLVLQTNNTDRVTIDASGNANFSGNVTSAGGVTAPSFTGTLNGALSTASGSAPSYSARAWVNFNGTGTVAIRASGNVSSITDNGVGDYTVNFTTAMPDANYSTNITQNIEDSSTYSQHIGVLTASNASYSLKSTSQVRLRVRNTVASNFDPFDVNVAIFR